jgi:nucleoside-diphosphate-sugar epimerase
MKYCILGSEGQIGSALTSWLTNKGYAVNCIDIVKTLGDDLRIQGNTKVEKAIKDSDFIFFLAFDVGGARYLPTHQFTYEFIANNTAIMKETFDILRRYNKPFIFASSQMSNMSYSPYGICKALGEFYTKSLGGIIVKFWNVYGVERDLLKSHVITDFVIQARDNKLIKMLTNGQEERQMLYSEDCSECLEILSKQYNNIPRDKELHCTSFQWIKIIDIAYIIANKFPDTVVKLGNIGDNIQFNKKNKPDLFIRNYWKSKTDLNDGITKICNYYKSIS